MSYRVTNTDDFIAHKPVLPRVLENGENDEIFLRDVLLRGNQEFARGPFEFLKKDIDFSKVKTILEIGCGLGFLSSLLALEYPDKVVTGIDSSLEMISSAKEKFEHIPNLKLSSADLFDLKKDAYDLVICDKTFHHFPDFSLALSRMMDQVAEGGHLFILDFLRDISPAYLKSLESLEKQKVLLHNLLTSSITASISIKEVLQLTQKFNQYNHDLYLFSTPGPPPVKIPSIRWVITR